VPFSPAREEAVRFWRELRGPALTPIRAAIAALLGLASGGLAAGALPPNLSVGMFVAMFVAIVAPLIAGICFVCIWFQLDGVIALLCAALVWLTRSAFRSGVALDMPEAAMACLVIGAPLTAYAIAYLVPSLRPRKAYALPADAPPWFLAVERVAGLFAAPLSPRPTDRMRFHWVRTKLLGDPVAKLAVDLASGSVLDIGTGRGQVPLLLLLLGRVSRVHGIDWDAAKIAAAQHAAAGLAASFVREDMRTARFEPVDTVLLLDALHYFTVEEQDALLDRAAAAVLPGGRILVREADASAGWRSAMTLWEERVFTFLRVNRGERVRFRTARDLVARLEAAGLDCEVRPAWRGTPFANVLLVGRRPAGPEPDRSRS
jgi:SAM-dependent methyltransferase